jgi:signal transduction histidine kinase
MSAAGAQPSEPIRRPVAVTDLALAGGTAAIAVGFALVKPLTFGRPLGPTGWVLIAIQVVGAATLLARRHAPLTVAAVNAALSVFAATLAAAPATYAAIAYAARPYRSWVVTAVMLVVTARPWALKVSRVGEDITVSLPPMLLLVAIAAALGLRSRRTRIRQAHAARDRALVAEQAKAEERARLASEMHDVITHRVSLMVLQAGALQVSTTDEAVRRQADELRRSGRQALGELRELLSVIRREPPDEAARSTELATLDLSDLVAASRGVGVPVELITDGTPMALSSVVARTAYRVVQESLTNVRKHAPGASVRLSVRYDDDRLRLTVRNTSPAERGSPLDGGNTGAGLDGLRRRVELLDGTLQAGPRVDGGFEVAAALPTAVAR